MSLAHKYRNTFFIFPAFLPLLELLPWALTLLGAVAGGTQIVSKAVWQRPWLRYGLLVIGVGLCAAGGWLLWLRYGDRPDATVGSALEVQNPRVEQHQPKPERPLSLQDISPLTLLWTVPAPENNLGKPIVVDGVLYLGTLNGTFDALRATDGQRLWTLHKKEPVFTAPTVTAQRVYVGEGHHYSTSSLLTAQAKNGAVLWSRQFRSHIESYPAVDEASDRLWISGGDTGLWGLTASSGKLRWWRQIGDMDVPPLYAVGRLFAVAKPDANQVGAVVHELDPDTGKTLWTLNLEGDRMGSLLPDDKGNFYLGTAKGQVGVVKSSNAGWAHGVSMAGKLLWSVKLPAMAMPEGAISADKSLLLFALQDGRVIALRTADGSTAWEARIGSEIETDIALIEDISPPMVAAVANDGSVSIRELMTGKERHQLSVEHGDSNPAYGNGIFFVATPNSIRAYSGWGKRP